MGVRSQDFLVGRNPGTQKSLEKQSATNILLITNLCPALASPTLWSLTCHRAGRWKEERGASSRPPQLTTDPVGHIRPVSPSRPNTRIANSQRAERRNQVSSLKINNPSIMTSHLSHRLVCSLACTPSRTKQPLSFLLPGHDLLCQHISIL
jgi:hypothetical protein